MTENTVHNIFKVNIFFKCMQNNHQGILCSGHETSLNKLKKTKTNKIEIRNKRRHKK